MAALTAAGELASMAQVFSVNMVGYVNIPLASRKFALIANQLDNKQGNTIAQLIPTAPSQTVVYHFDYAFQAFSTSSQFDGAVGGAWDNPTLAFPPGEGMFIFPFADMTATFVGEVVTGTSSLDIKTGYQVYSGIIPQAGYMHDPLAPGSGNVDLGLGIPVNNQQIYNWSAPLQAFATSHAWVDGAWNDANGPVLQVGEAVLGFSPPISGTKTWTRTFNVGP
jgi:hypothetical protein